MLQLNVLGMASAEYDGVSLQFQTDKVCALLAYLALNRGQAVRRAALAEMFWPNRTSKAARNNLRKGLFHLRRMFGEAADTLFVPATRTVQLNSAEFATDIHQFNALLDQVEHHTHSAIEQCESCLKNLKQATTLYAGELLAGLVLPDADEFHEWLSFERERLFQRVLWALDALTTIELKCGRFVSAQRYAMRQIALEPWRESAHGQLMIALARQGQVQAAFKQYDACRTMLREELGISPSAELRAILSDLHSEPTEPDEPAPLAPKHNLTRAATPFLGRMSEKQRLTHLLQDSLTRWVTLVGQGGVGKSRLAQEIGYELLPHFADGVWFVPLAGLDGSRADAVREQQIATAIAVALGVQLRGKESADVQLRNYLSNKRLLLILDNFEHLLDGAALVNQLIEAADQLAILCTSRSALQFRAEYCLPLNGLATPPAPAHGKALDAEMAASWQQFASLQLFADCANRVSDSFALTVETLPTVAKICRWVGGNALGIELAASWMRYKSAEKIWQQLQQSYTILHSRLRDVPTRHRSMKVVFEQSWTLLSTDEQQTMAQLSVFRGGFDALAAAAIVGVDEFDLFDLAEKSLLQQLDEQFVVHEALRQFSAERLSADARSTLMRDHSTFYLCFVADRADAMQRDNPLRPASEIELELDNVQQAWRTALDNFDVENIAVALHGLSNYYQLRGRSREAEQLFGELHALFESQTDRQAQRIVARARVEQGRYLNRLTRCEEALAVAQSALPLAEAIGDEWAYDMGRIISAEALWRQGYYDRAKNELESTSVHTQPKKNTIMGWYHYHVAAIHTYANQWEAACEHCQAALLIWRHSRQLSKQASSLNLLGNIYMRSGEYETALDYFSHAIEIDRELSNQAHLVWTQLNLGILLIEQGKFVAARQICQETIALAEQLGNREALGTLTHNLGYIENLEGNYEVAIGYLTKTMQMLKTNENLFLRGRTLGNLGIAAYGLNELNIAYRHYQQAHQTAQQSQDTYIISKSLLGMARITHQHGELEQARSLGKRALHAARELPQDDIKCECRAFLANL